MTNHSSNVREHFGIRFSLLARRWRRAIDAHLAAAGLTDATWVPLVHLQESGDGMTQKTLAALVGIDSSSLVRLLDILSREGLLERRADTADGRARRIYLTPAGRKRVAEIRAQLLRAEEALLADLSDAEISTMLGHFEHIAQRIDALQPGKPEAQ